MKGRNEREKRKGEKEGRNEREKCVKKRFQCIINRKAHVGFNFKNR